MNWTVTFYSAILFFVLTPAVLIRLPPKGNKFTVAAVHAVVFALIFHFTHKIVWQLSMGMGMPMHKEGMVSCDVGQMVVDGKCVVDPSYMSGNNMPSGNYMPSGN
jgi:hypothetical protein